MTRQHEQHRDAGGQDPLDRRQAIRALLLLTGPLATLLYIGLDAFAARRYRGYSYTDQTISELSAVGAPTRGLWLPVALVYSGLMTVFGAAIWLSAGRRLAVRAVAVAAGAVGVLGLVAWPFAPMHQREYLAREGGTLSDRMHLALGAIDSLLFFTAAASGATALGKRFRLYSLATILLLLGFGTAMSADSPKVGRNEPTPWLGIKERIAIFSPMVWMAAFGIALLRSTAPPVQEASDRTERASRTTW